MALLMVITQAQVLNVSYLQTGNIPRKMVFFLFYPDNARRSKKRIPWHQSPFPPILSTLHLAKEPEGSPLTPNYPVWHIRETLQPKNSLIKSNKTVQKTQKIAPSVHPEYNMQTGMHISEGNGNYSAFGRLWGASTAKARRSETRTAQNHLPHTLIWRQNDRQRVCPHNSFCSHANTKITWKGKVRLTS